MTRTSETCKVKSVRERRFHFALCTIHYSLCSAFIAIVVVLSQVGLGVSQEPTPPPSKPNLANDQDAIKARYKRFNLTLQQMAEILRKQDPERADLLFRALGKSQESRIEDQMSLIFALLNKEQPQLGEAIDRQEELLGQLKNLLDLLQSEDRRSEIEKEKQRLQDLLKDINKLIGKEKDIRAGTERGDDTKKLADKQGDAAKQADQLGQKIDQQDAEKNGEVKPSSKSQKPDDSKNGEQKPGDKDAKPTDDKKEGDDKKSEKSDKPSDDKKSDDGKKPEGSKPSDMNKSDKNGEKSDQPKDGSKSQKPSDQKSDKNQPGKPQDDSPDGQPMPDGQKPEDGQQQDSNQQPDPKKQKTPGRKQLEESRDAMRRAIEELKKQQRDEASKEQDEAIRKLMEAKDKIEEILRQLREEEQKLMLAALEARFKKMLAAQLIIYHDTVRLSKAGESERASVQARAVKLSQDEQEILIDTEKALILLKEEGSSIAFPESVASIRQDVQTLVGWLRDAKVGELTQAVEKDVIEALEELIEALQQEMEKSDEEKKQQQQQQDQEQSQPLVDQLAELKMLRSLQLRVNRRTKQLSRTFEGEQATQEEAVQQLQQLSGRQARIQQATSDLVKGKNK